MDPLIFGLATPLIAELVRGRRVARVFPAAQSGLHVALEGRREGLRLDTRPARGAALPFADAPARVRGGRGAWSDLAGAADRDLSGHVISDVVFGLSPPALVLVLDEGSRLGWASARRGGVIVFLPARAAARRLPHGDAEIARALLPPEAPVFEPGAAARALLVAAGTRAPDDPALADDARAALSFLPRRRGEALVAGALDAPPEDDAESLGATPIDAAGQRLGARLEELAAWLFGELPRVVLRGAGPLDEPPEAGEAEHLRLEPLFSAPPAASEAAPSDSGDAKGLAAGLALWYRRALAAEALATRRDALLAAARAELKRVRRARRAVEGDARAARDPEALRREGEALLAAPPESIVDESDELVVPDPRAEGATLRVRRGRSGESAAELAAQLYARARKEERGAALRAERAGALERRAALLEPLVEALSGSPGRSELERADEALRAAGLLVEAPPPGVPAPPRVPAARGGAGGREKAPPARVYRSPGGFEVLVGRTARQNDRLTFRIAAPDDHFLHVAEHPGAHVVVRREGRREPGQEDLLFAARLAAAFSQVAEGTAVDVHLARRKYVRKPKGAAPGAVLVRKFKVLRVVAGPPPADV